MLSWRRLSCEVLEERGLRFLVPGQFEVHLELLMMLSRQHSSFFSLSVVLPRPRKR